MYEWERALQKMIGYLEEHIAENPTLEQMARQIGYSPYYCSSRFSQIVGMNIRSYLAGRRLCRAAIALRDSDERILDIAIACGYSSQEALTRAFVRAFSCTPGAYRKNQRPIALPIIKNVFFPEHYQKGEQEQVEENCLREASVRVAYLPAHKYIGVFEERAQSYFELWEHQSCDAVCGMLESMSNLADPILGIHTAGWFYEQGEKKGYCYGMGAPAEYAGEVPEGFSLRNVPGGYYLVFFHPPFDFFRDCEEVMNRVEKMAEEFDPTTMGFVWQEGEKIDYQRHLSEDIGYEIWKPVKRA